MSRPDDGRIWDRDRLEHATRRRNFVLHTGRAAFPPALRVTAEGKEWCRFVIYEHGITLEQGKHRYRRKWAVYAFSELARFACECIRTGDRIMVYGLERGRNVWVDEHGQRHEIEDITAWDLGQSMLRWPAFSERNEGTRYSRNMRRVEEGWSPAPDDSRLPEGPPPDY